MKLSIEAGGAALAAAALVLQGCDNPRANDPGIYKAEWSRRDDGSSFATKDTGSDNRAAYRCWPEGKGFECLVAAEGPMGAITIARSNYDELPRILLPIAGGGSGYDCSSVLGRTREAISAPDGNLISNDAAPWWSRRFVKDYMMKNKVEGQAWFPCLKVLDLVRQGSLATLRTTTISRDFLGLKR